MRFYKIDRRNYSYIEKPIIDFFKNLQKIDYLFKEDLRIKYNNTNLDFVSYENNVLKEIAEIKNLKEYKICATNWIRDHQEKLDQIEDIFRLSIGSLAIIATIECQLKVYLEKTHLREGWLIWEGINKFKLYYEIIDALYFAKEKSLIKDWNLYLYKKDCCLGFINIQI